MVESILQSLSASSSGEPLCIQFVNTVGSRRSSTPSEYLPSPSALVEWLKRRGFGGDFSPTDEAFRLRALHLRDSMYRIFSRVAEGGQPDEQDVNALNDELCETLAKIELGVDMEWRLTEEKPGDRALMLLSLCAAELLSSFRRVRIRECADAHCGWIFIDQSKNRSRRWCSMSDCGNLEKARRFQSRQKAK